MIGGIVLGGGDPVDDLGEGQEFGRRNLPQHCTQQLGGVMTPGARSMPRAIRAAQNLGCSVTASLVFGLPCRSLETT